MVGPELVQVWAECEARSSAVLSRVRGTGGTVSLRPTAVWCLGLSVFSGDVFIHDQLVRSRPPPHLLPMRGSDDSGPPHFQTSWEINSRLYLGLISNFQERSN